MQAEFDRLLDLTCALRLHDSRYPMIGRNLWLDSGRAPGRFARSIRQLLILTTTAKIH
jgi:hypothetical protein